MIISDSKNIDIDAKIYKIYFTQYIKGGENN